MSEVVTPTNLGPEFDLGAIQAGKVRLKIGAGLAIQPDGTIVATGSTPGAEPAWGSVAADGTATNISQSSAVRLAVGRYQITLDNARPNNDYPIVLGMEDTAARDDISVYYINRTTTTFQVQITEQDNGGAAGTYRDRAFSFFLPPLT